MARRNRMGAYNALDELLPGPAAARPGPERSPHPAPNPPKRTTRPKRMGLYNALDDLLPGPGSGPEADPPTPGLDWAGLDWGAPDPPRPDRPTGTRRGGSYDPYDHLLPGPQPPPTARPGSPSPGLPSGAEAGTVFDALDDLLPGPPAPSARPARVRASFSLPPEVLDAVRDAAAHLSSGPNRVTLAELAERALKTELDRLAAKHNRGRPFPRRPGR